MNFSHRPARVTPTLHREAVHRSGRARLVVISALLGMGLTGTYALSRIHTSYTRFHHHHRVQL